MRRFSPIFFLLASAGLFFMYVDPTYDGLGALKEDSGKLDEALNRAKELQSIRDQLLSKYNTFLPEDLERLRKLLPQHIDNVRLIIDIDEIASRYGMTVSKLSISGGESGGSGEKESGEGARARPGATSAMPGAQSAGAGATPEAVRPAATSASGENAVGSVELSFSVSSSYDTFLAFLRDLEQSLRLVDVTKLSFSASSADFYDFSIAFRTYWLR